MGAIHHVAVNENASRETVDFHIRAMRSKADNIKNLCNNRNCYYVFKL